MLGAQTGKTMMVGIKSFSITRLKRQIRLPHQIPHLRWNQKFLDYEIETKNGLRSSLKREKLESKVSRLRD